MGIVGGILVPGQRLAAAAELAAVSYFEGDILPYCAIDVGCDHARLAVYLVQKGYSSHVYATDIAQGPVEKAKRNISQRTLKGKSLEDYITVIKTDGLCGMENYGASRIFICGMGGKTIIDILNNAQFLKNKHLPPVLILQPQSDAFEVRCFLYDNGYNIVNEKVVMDGRFVYPLICAYFDGKVRTKKLIDLALGSINLDSPYGDFEKLFSNVKKSTYNRLCALKQNRLDYTQDRLLYKQLCDFENNTYFKKKGV